MEKCEMGRKSSRVVPVIIENHENAVKKTKLMVPSNYTAAQLVNILRSRNHLLPFHPVYLFLKSQQSPVLMTKRIGHLHRKHRDDKGQLRLIHAEQASFGFRGNIRAIRFRQKWIENHHTNTHQDAGGPPLYSGVPPPYFPSETPATSNFGAPLDFEDAYDLIEPFPFINNGFLEMFESSFLNEMDDSLPASDEQNSWQSSNTNNSSQPSSSTVPSESSAPALISSLSTALVNPWPLHMPDAWLPSAATNSDHTSGTVNSSASSFSAENDVYLQQIMTNIYNSFVPGHFADLPATSASANVQPSNASNPEDTSNDIPSIIIYDSDSDFYDSDKDVEMDN